MKRSKQQFSSCKLSLSTPSSENQSTNKTDLNNFYNSIHWLLFRLETCLKGQHSRIWVWIPLIFLLLKLASNPGSCGGLPAGHDSKSFMKTTFMLKDWLIKYSGKKIGQSISLTYLYALHCRDDNFESFSSEADQRSSQPLFRLFLVFSKQTSIQFYDKSMWKNVHPAYSAWIRTHDLQNMSLLP